MVRYAFHVGKPGQDLSPIENISSMVVADREARDPFIPRSPKLRIPAMSPLSLTFSLTMPSAERIFAARLRGPPTAMFK
jgi:hypothetical protein